MKKIIRLTEDDLTRIVKRVISESSLGEDMLKTLADKLKKKYPKTQYDEGDKNFDPYVYIPIGKKTGLLIDLDGNDNFEIHYDNGVNDKPWIGWKKEIERLNSVSNTLKAVMMYMDKKEGKDKEEK